MTDWLTVAHAERSLLYQAFKRARDESGRAWEDVLNDALGNVYFRVDSYVNNFRAGRNSRAHCVRLFAWLQKQRQDLAADLEASIQAFNQTITPVSTWEIFVNTQGEYDKIRVIKGPVVPTGRRQHQQEQHQIQVGSPPPPPPRVEFRQSFIFEIESPTAGYLLVFQWIAGIWRTLHVTKFELGLAVDKGMQRLPPGTDALAGLDISSAVAAYHEDHEGGLHRLAFLILPNDIGTALGAELSRFWKLDLEQLEPVANATLGLERTSWCLLRADLLFPNEPVDARGKAFPDRGQQTYQSQ